MNKRKRKKIADWLSYTIGFSGRGPTAIDMKPSRALGRREKETIKKLQKVIDEIKVARQEAWKTAYSDVLGEDPDDDYSDC